MGSLTSVCIRIEDNTNVFSCRGRAKNLCDKCRLRFACLSERNEVCIPKGQKIKDLNSLVEYMFGEGKLQYILNEKKLGNKTVLVMELKND